MPLLSSVALAPLLVAGALSVGTPGVSLLTAAPVVRAPGVAAPVPDAPAKPAPRCVGAAALGRARDYARSRPGHVSFAVSERGQLRSWQGAVPYRSASLVKAMLLVADLRRHARLHAPLGAGDRARLAAMIRTSDNGQATVTFNLVGAEAVRAVARASGMRNYRVGNDWGGSQLTASDQARFFGRLSSLLPAQYRRYARRLLRTIVPYQTWGGAPVTRRHGFHTMFKSGWLPTTGGWVVHQGLRLERGSCTIGIAVLTGNQPSMAAGETSIRGVVERLV